MLREAGISDYTIFLDRETDGCSQCSVPRRRGHGFVRRQRHRATLERAHGRPARDPRRQVGGGDGPRPCVPHGLKPPSQNGDDACHADRSASAPQLNDYVVEAHGPSIRCCASSAAQPAKMPMAQMQIAPEQGALPRLPRPPDRRPPHARDRHLHRLQRAGRGARPAGRRQGHRARRQRGVDGDRQEALGGGRRRGQDHAPPRAGARQPRRCSRPKARRERSTSPSSTPTSRNMTATTRRACAWSGRAD